MYQGTVSGVLAFFILAPATVRDTKRAPFIPALLLIKRYQESFLHLFTTYSKSYLLHPPPTTVIAVGRASSIPLHHVL